MKTKSSNDDETKPMAYDALLAIVLLEKEYYANKDEKTNIKAERVAWYKTGIKCTCDRKLDQWGEYADGGDQYDGTCPFCNKRNEYHERLNKIANRQRAIRNTIRSCIKHYC